MMMPQPCLLLARRSCCSPAFLAPSLLLVWFRFWTEIYQGAKMFYMSGVINGKYLKSEVRNTALYISRMKFRPLTWRNTHPYVVVDRFEDITPPDLLQQDPNVRTCLRLPPYGACRAGADGAVGSWAGRCLVCRVCLSAQADRELVLYGYVRGSHLKPSMKVHLIGAGDFDLHTVRRRSHHPQARRESHMPRR